MVFIDFDKQCAGKPPVNICLRQGEYYLFRFTLSTKKSITISLEEWISPAQAARIRGVTRQAINKLIRHRRVETMEIAGKTLVKLSDIRNFQRKPPGRKRRTGG